MDKKKALYTFTCKLRKKPTFWYTADKLNEKMPNIIPTISEMLAQHKRDMRKYEANRRIDSMLRRKVMQRSLSFAEAIEVVRETGASVAHEYWQSTRLVPSSNVAGFMVFTCGLHTNMLTLDINMIDSGWRVLDK